jgi:hypothetical protein
LAAAWTAAWRVKPTTLGVAASAASTTAWAAADAATEAGAWAVMEWEFQAAAWEAEIEWQLAKALIHVIDGEKVT